MTRTDHKRQMRASGFVVIMIRGKPRLAKSMKEYDAIMRERMEEIREQREQEQFTTTKIL